MTDRIKPAQDCLAYTARQYGDLLAELAVEKAKFPSTDARLVDLEQERDQLLLERTEYQRIDASMAATILKLSARIAALDAALAVVNQALLEVAHAQSCGANWYTRGASGLYQQVAMWVRKGREAIAKAAL